MLLNRCWHVGSVVDSDGITGSYTLTFDVVTAAPTDLIAAAIDGFAPSEDMFETTAEEDLPMVDVVSVTSESKEYRLTGRPSTQLYLSCDPDAFSTYQGKFFRDDFWVAKNATEGM